MHSELLPHKVLEWRTHPALFVEECLGARPDDWQIDVLEAFPYEQRIALKACKGPGKTCVLSWLSWNFLVTRPQCKIAATSISSDNLADGLWTEMALWQSKSHLLEQQFSWSKTRIVLREAPETHWMSARAWSKSASREQQADTLAGLHADYLLFMLDEAGGIPDGVMAAAEAGLSTGIETKLLIAGNPTHLEGPLFRACDQERHLWWVKEITGDPDDPKRAKRISIQWAREQIEKYGRDNPWVLVNVFGKFPPSSMNTLLSHEEVRSAMGRHYNEQEYRYAQKRMGIDVARFGDDRTVLFPRQGLAAFEPVTMRGIRTDNIAARVLQGVHRWGGDVELFVDDTGHWGHGVIDCLITAGQSPMGLQYHAPSIDPRYRNRRAEMWFAMAEWIKRGGSLPNIPELVAELTTPTYFFNGGKLQLEDKDQIKQRLQRSPDLADALANTFALPEMPATTTAQTIVQAITHAHNNGNTDEAFALERRVSNYDYDPLARA
jgi:hypothetical protein